MRWGPVWSCGLWVSQAGKAAWPGKRAAAGNRERPSAEGFDTVWRRVRCYAGVEARPLGSWPPEARTYGQSRGVIPFSCAYLAADVSTRGRTNAWSVAIQSVIAFHCVPSHCWNFTLPPPS
jgi:hypothetical protein